MPRYRLNGDVISLERERARRGFAKAMKPLSDAFVQADKRREAIEYMLVKMGFPPIYAREAAEDLADAWLNGDPVPMWYQPWYEVPDRKELRADVRPHLKK